MRVAEGLATAICVLSRLVGADWGPFGGAPFLLWPAPKPNSCSNFVAVLVLFGAPHIQQLQLLAMDASARTTMKGAAKCDKHCELQNSVNQQNPERILCFRDIPESMSASESPLYPAALAWSLAAFLRVRARSGLLVGSRSDVFNASICLESANLVIALAGVSSRLFASSWGRCPPSLPRVVNQDMKLGKVTR